MTKAEQHYKSLHENFSVKLSAAFEKWYNLKLENTFDFFGTGRLVSKRVDGEQLTSDQYQFINGFSEGYAAAMNHVFNL